MRIKTLSLILLATSYTPAMAQDSTGVLRDALGGMPDMILSNPDAMQVFFLDVQAWQGLSAGEITPPAMMRLAIAQNIYPLQVVNYGGLTGWDEKAGVALDELRYLAGFGQPPFMVGYWGLGDSAAAAQLIETLSTNGFTPTEGAPEGIFGNGEPNASNLQNRDPANPWIGALGRSSFVAQIDSAVIQAPAPEAAITLQQTTPSAAENAFLSAALGGLDATVGGSDGQIVQALVLSPAFGLESFDPALILGAGDIEQAKAALEAAIEESQKGIPPYFSGILADVQYDGRPALTISLTYADCETAEVAATALETRWIEAMNNAAKISSASVPTDDSYCAAVVNFVGDETADASNPLLMEFMGRYMRRDFNLLQIGIES